MAKLSYVGIRNQQQGMQYRRFGSTGQQLSVITLGGMRYHEGWAKPREEVPAPMLEQCVAMIRTAFAAGVNHIETAHGYGRSEYCYGKALNEVLKLPRRSYHLMTKGNPTTAAEARQKVEEQLKGLQTDHLDLYGWHGINNAELLKTACAKGGPVEELLKMQGEGMIGSVGFSTHGPVEVICDAIATGLFSFVNLHYYYFFQRNLPAVVLANCRDMGVFIISPNDKGGQLFNAPPLLKKLCSPLTPIQFNARWCLRNSMVQTLSFGMTEAPHVEEMRGIFPLSIPADATTQQIEQRLNERVLVDPISAYDGYEFVGDPSGINIPEVLRFRRMWKCYDMKDFGLYRYNMLESKGHWFPGSYALPELVDKVETHRAPAGVDIKALLRETHAALYKPKEQKAG